jgi:hypothetical protein
LHDPHDEVRLVEQPDRRHPFIAGDALDGGEVDVRRQVAIAWMPQPGRRVVRRFGPR